eukprot:3936009-Pyramimonas_sp.AAC.1
MGQGILVVILRGAAVLRSVGPRGAPRSGPRDGPVEAQAAARGVPLPQGEGAARSPPGGVHEGEGGQGPRGSEVARTIRMCS